VTSMIHQPLAVSFSRSIMSLQFLKFSWLELHENLNKITATIVPPLNESAHKGSMGRIGVIGGSRDYCGAPYYSSVSALKLGADLSWIFCSQESAIPIKSYSPELMVTPFYKDELLLDLYPEDPHVKVAFSAALYTMQFIIYVQVHKFPRYSTPIYLFQLSLRIVRGSGQCGQNY
jgi:hypothetical protein